MRDAILEKLNQHLAAGITREADALYLLAQIRKLFEHEKNNKQYPALSFFANWCLHTKIDRQPFADQLLRQIDDLLSMYQHARNPVIGLGTLNLFTIGQFLRELQEFCRERNVGLNGLLDHQHFIALVLQVIKDAPVLTKDNLQCLLALSIIDAPNSRDQNQRAVPVWCITTKSGQYHLPLI